MALMITDTLTWGHLIIEEMVIVTRRSRKGRLIFIVLIVH
jgi:hypothetical protein